jgi:hypothetical protein
MRVCVFDSSWMTVHAKVDALRKKQLKLTHVIQGNEENYQALVKEASLRRAPTQNGSARRAYLDTVHKEHSFQMAQRPPDRRIYSRLYSKVDDFTWQLDEQRYWYTRNAADADAPDMPLQSYGFKAVWMPGDGPSNDMTGALNRTLTKPSYLAPLPPSPKRESISAMQRRAVAKMPPRLGEDIHWSNDIATREFQVQQRTQHPLYGRIDIAEPPFRPLPVAAAAH